MTLNGKNGDAVNHYNLHDLTQGILRCQAPGINSRIFIGDNLMLSVCHLNPHTRGDVHSHPEEQWGLLLEGSCVRIQDGIEQMMSAGDFWQTPGGVPHGMYTTIESAIVLDIFSPPRPGYREAGEGYG